MSDELTQELTTETIIETSAEGAAHETESTDKDEMHEPSEAEPEQSAA